MPIWQKAEEKQENFYICREKEKGMLFLVFVVEHRFHTMRQETTNDKVFAYC